MKVEVKFKDLETSDVNTIIFKGDCVWFQQNSQCLFINSEEKSARMDYDIVDIIDIKFLEI